MCCCWLVDCLVGGFDVGCGFVIVLRVFGVCFCVLMVGYCPTCWGLRFTVGFGFRVVDLLGIWDAWFVICLFACCIGGLVEFGCLWSLFVCGLLSVVYRFGLLLIVVGCFYLVRFLSRFCCGFWVCLLVICLWLVIC